MAPAAGLAIALAVSGTAAAQEVTLRAHNGELNIRGTLLGLEDGVYRIDTIMGVLGVPAEAVECIGEACPPDPRNGIPGAVVELSDPSGETRLRGKLVEFTGDTYTIDTALGVLELPAASVICTGPGCPLTTAAKPAPSPGPVEDDAAPAETAAAPREDRSGPQAAAESEPDTPTAASFAPPAEEVAQRKLIQLARMKGPADLRLAGPEPILEALAPAVSDSLADALGASVARAEVEYVSLPRARATGMPAGSMGLIFAGGEDGPVNVLGRYTSGSEPTLKMLEDGAADLIFAPTPASLSDERLAGGLVLGSDGMVAVVAPNNPVTKIPTGALASVFAGEITDWAELGGPPGPIRLVGLPESHAASASLSELVLAPAGLVPRPADVVVPDVATLADIVAGDPQAIGFVNNATRKTAKPLELVTSCGLHTAPGPDTFRTRRYPFTQAIVALQGGDSALAAGLLGDLAAAPELFREIGFADDGIDLQSLDSDRQMLAGRTADLSDNQLRDAAANALAGMETARRLSQVLYFERGTNRLDPQSRDALARVLDWLEDNQVGEAFLVGHAPAGGAPGHAMDAARAAADLVRQEITLSEGAPLDVVFRRLALGGLLPVVCPGDINHAASNSRVEIWVRARG